MNTKRAFTLVELLVVIGIIGLLISMLLPAMNKVRSQSKAAVCASNLRQVGAALLIYANDNKGWLVPVGEWLPNQRIYESLGTNVPANLRWPVVALKIHGDQNDPDDAEKWTTPTMICPADFQPGFAHSYIINKHLVGDDKSNSPDSTQGNQSVNVKKYGSKIGGGKTVSDIILLGEKVSTARDYYMEIEPGDSQSEFWLIVERYRHGSTRGSNYLFMDMHVDNRAPADVANAVDPWGLPPTTQPTP